MDGDQRFRFNVEIPFIEVGQGPLVVEMSGKESENAEVSLMGLGLAFTADGSEYTSDLLNSVLPGNYTIEVTPAGGIWESPPPTIVSIRLSHRSCSTNCPSTCPGANVCARKIGLGGTNSK